MLTEPPTPPLAQASLFKIEAGNVLRYGVIDRAIKNVILVTRELQGRAGSVEVEHSNASQVRTRNPKVAKRWLRPFRTLGPEIDKDQTDISKPEMIRRIN